MSTDFYVYETQSKYARTCTKCKKGMNEGYLDELTGNTYCSAVCIEKDYTPEKIRRQLLDNLFWTNWHEDVEELE